MRDMARDVRASYAELEQRRHGRSWTREEIMLGFVGDVGDLAKLVQGMEGIRPTPDLEAKLAHELADCLWAVLTLAESYGVDLEGAYAATMRELAEHIAHQV